ncbi:MAG: helix-turn-helix transcriptional regulator [Streptococcus halitosis]|jgi:phage repressor protein C with HTH and peptisase S24 domain|uniref:LexA family transcriptional regulator n=1 Tax=unclassified Streptococcus TaxID=2608887 RepID=UPI00146B275B|nr:MULTISPECIES: XRE family transcriptional regulator [unclassified Streptococcus]NMD84148.1 helix-turn-helix transcriptional regulator [Streptococcus sp. WB01_FAA12]NMD84197.1 helix-turn-helix transcriptional regulator [Streptococcus sp. WB01_FAA12]
MSNNKSKEIFSANLENLMSSKGIDRNKLCSDLGLKYTTVRDWLKGITYPRIGKIELLADYFGVNKSDLIEDKTQEVNELKIPTSPLIHKITEKVVKLSTPRKQKVLNYANEQLKEQNNKVITIEEKLFEYRVFEKLSAGTGFSYFNDGNYDTVFYDKDLDHDFASWVFGDSMEPKFQNGEVVLIKETGFDYDGAVYAVDWDGQTYIKKVYREPDGLRLVSLNPKYKDKFAPFEEDPRIIGKIVGNFMPSEN